MRNTDLPRGFASASVGSFRIDRSWRFFDTACSRNEDFPFDRRLFEKLSLLNILDRSVGRRYSKRVAQQNHSKVSRRMVVEMGGICVAFGRKMRHKIKRKRKKELNGRVGRLYMQHRPRVPIFVGKTRPGLEVAGKTRRNCKHFTRASHHIK